MTDEIRILSDGFQIYNEDGSSEIYDIIPPSPTTKHRGGIIAETKTEEYTVEVKVGEDGKGYVPVYPNALDKDNTEEYVPVDDYNPATKKYVDDTVTTIDVQADWNVNDETDKAYIQNRTHYETTTTTLENILTEEVVMESTPSHEFPDVIDIADGETYTVTFNGVSQEIVCELGTLPFEYNGYIYEITFSFIEDPEGTAELLNGTLTIDHHVVGTEVKTLDEKYIPDTIARTVDIPTKASDIDAQISDFIVNVDLNKIADKTWSEVNEAKNQGRRCYAVYGGSVYEYENEGYDHSIFVNFTGKNSNIIYLYDYTQTVDIDTRIFATTTELDKKITSPTTASIGQVLSVKSVDENNTPTEWEAIDPSSFDEIYIGSGEMPDGYKIQINPNEDSDEFIDQYAREQILTLGGNIPTKTSQLENDSNYQTNTEVQSAITTALEGLDVSGGGEKEWTYIGKFTAEENVNPFVITQKENGEEFGSYTELFLVTQFHFFKSQTAGSYNRKIQLLLPNNTNAELYLTSLGAGTNNSTTDAENADDVVPSFKNPVTWEIKIINGYLTALSTSDNMNFTGITILPTAARNRGLYIGNTTIKGLNVSVGAAGNLLLKGSNIEIWGR